LGTFRILWVFYLTYCIFFFYLVYLTYNLGDGNHEF
jgi:hypothetical protein